MIKFPIFTYT